MKKYLKPWFYYVLFIMLFFVFALAAKAEDLPSGVIPKLPTTPNDPVLQEGQVYPFWGPVCQRYTYSVIYSDKEGRPPEYVKIYFNGKMIDMEKEDPNASDYKNGVKYIYKNVPNKFGSNFYYFEASNGLGKTRDSIIDSPDNGPVLFDSDFLKNEIILIDPVSGKEVWRYETGEEWVGAVTFSSDGKYLAAETSNHVYLFDTAKNKPIWEYKSPAQNQIGGDVKGGVAISADGSKIFAALGSQALMFSKNSNNPIWKYNLAQNGGNAYAVDISKNGAYAAVAMAGSETDENSNVLLVFDSGGKKLWQYHSTGNWHDVNFSEDGNFLAGSTGCPDRKGYLFSVDSNTPIISENLSVESPVDEARISADGRLAAFGVESGYGAVVLMDKDSKKVVFKFDTPQKRTVRALSITPDGAEIGAGTFGGDVLIFNNSSSTPIQQFNINTTIGAFDLADDGSFFATGSTDKKVRIFDKGSDKPKSEFTLNEYVGEIDISSNGKFVAASTSGAVYFFDTILDLDQTKTFPCDKVIEPKPQSKSNVSAPKNTTSETSWPFWASVTGAAILAILLLGYIIVFKKRQRPISKIVVIILALLIVILIGISLCLRWEPNKDNTAVPENNSTNLNSSSDNATCGNSLCEPDNGENKNNCPKDCSGDTP